MKQSPAEYYLFYVAILLLTWFDPKNLLTLEAVVINNFCDHKLVAGYKILKIALAVKSINSAISVPSVVKQTFLSYPYKSFPSLHVVF